MSTDFQKSFTVELGTKFIRRSLIKSLKLKLTTNLYSATKSEDSEALDSGTSQLGSQGGLMKQKCFEAVSKDS